MRFGVGDFSGQLPPDSSRTHGQLYRELIVQAGLIEAAGLDSMWLSEHHFAEDGYLPAVLPIAAALLATTERITVGTDRLLASLHDPIRLAEDAVALNLLGGGRFILGLSLCYRDLEFDGFGVDAGSDLARLEALVPLLRDSFAGRPISGRPPLREFPPTLVTPIPGSDGGPRVLIAADGKGGAERAGRLADLMMVDPTEPMTFLESAIAGFDNARGNSDGEVAIFVYGALSEHGSERAWADVSDGFTYMRHTYDRWMERPLTTALPPPHYRMLLGTPLEVAQQAGQYRERFGDRVHLVLRLNYPGMAASVVAQQIELWGDAARLSRDGAAAAI